MMVRQRSMRSAMLWAVIAVCLAVHRPDPELLEGQLASLRAQAGAAWKLVREDDDAGVGPWRAFERCLARVPADAGLVAPCDQDDVWHPDKLAALSAALGPRVMLAYGDVRVVDRAGALLAPTYFGDRANSTDDLGELLATNVVTGAAALLRREVLDVALPFPPELDGSFHDHWLAVCARALGAVAFVDRPVIDYVQHARNVVGHSGRRRGRSTSGLGWRARAARDRERHVERPRLWARTLLERCGGRLRLEDRRALERAAAAPLPWLVAGAVREQLRPARTLEARRRALRGALLG